jgi:hypothetical protein
MRPCEAVEREEAAAEDEGRLMDVGPALVARYETTQPAAALA